MVPKYAITMGVGTVMEAEKIVLLASGERKAEALKKTLKGHLTAMVPASMVQMYRSAHVIVDEDAASALEYRHHHGIAEPKGS